MSEEGSERKNPLEKSQLGVAMTMCFVLESLGAFQSYCSLTPWPLSQIFAVETE